MATVADFDALLAEADASAGQAATVPFKFLGKTWQLPVSPPAANMVRIRRLHASVLEWQLKIERGQATEADAEQMLAHGGDADTAQMVRLMVGDDLLDGWYDAGITDKQLKEVSRYLWLRYNDREADFVPGEAKPSPNRAAKRSAARKTSSTTSSRKRASSKRTSAGSTGSTSRKR